MTEAEYFADVIRWLHVFEFVALHGFVLMLLALPIYLAIDRRNERRINEEKRVRVERFMRDG